MACVHSICLRNVGMQIIYCIVTNMHSDVTEYVTLLSLQRKPVMFLRKLRILCVQNGFHIS